MAKDAHQSLCLQSAAPGEVRGVVVSLHHAMGSPTLWVSRPIGIWGAPSAHASQCPTVPFTSTNWVGRMSINRPEGPPAMFRSDAASKAKTGDSIGWVVY